jgi:thiamine-monophosphate kinase
VLLTTDMMVERIDFDLAYTSGKDVGWKATAINASDVASMGGRPTHAVAAVGLRPETPVLFVDDLLEGMLDAGDRFGVALVGGDVSAASEIGITVSMVGAAPARPLERSGARVGDAICVTGTLGGAAAGLIALRRGIAGAGSIARLKRRHLRPTARVAEAAALVTLAPTAMIDVSDGLAVDLGHVVDASGVGCEVDFEAIPIDPDITVIGDIDPVEIAVLGGEDFELLFTIDTARLRDAQKALERLSTPVTRIGTVTETGTRLGDRPLDDWRTRGWQHLRSG